MAQQFLTCFGCHTALRMALIHLDRDSLLVTNKVDRHPAIKRLTK